MAYICKINKQNSNVLKRKLQIAVLNLIFRFCRIRNVYFWLLYILFCNRYSVLFHIYVSYQILIAVQQLKRQQMTMLKLRICIRIFGLYLPNGIKQRFCVYRMLQLKPNIWSIKQTTNKFASLKIKS